MNEEAVWISGHWAIASVFLLFIGSIAMNVHSFHTKCIASGANVYRGQCIQGDLTPEILMNLGSVR